MKRRLTAAVALLTILTACAALVGTPTSADPQQEALTLTKQGCDATRAAVEATDTAVKAGKISKANATTAYAGFVAMQAGCNAAVAALKPAPAASGSAK